MVYVDYPTNVLARGKGLSYLGTSSVLYPSSSTSQYHVHAVVCPSHLHITCTLQGNLVAPQSISRYELWHCEMTFTSPRSSMYIARHLGGRANVSLLVQRSWWRSLQEPLLAWPHRSWRGSSKPQAWISPQAILHRLRPNSDGRAIEAPCLASYNGRGTLISGFEGDPWGPRTCTHKIKWLRQIPLITVLPWSQCATLTGLSIQVCG